MNSKPHQNHTKTLKMVRATSLLDGQHFKRWSTVKQPQVSNGLMTSCCRFPFEGTLLYFHIVNLHKFWPKMYNCLTDVQRFPGILQKLQEHKSLPPLTKILCQTPHILTFSLHYSHFHQNLRSLKKTYLPTSWVRNDWVRKKRERGEGGGSEKEE